jgi:hypothetical protein
MYQLKVWDDVGQEVTKFGKIVEAKELSLTESAETAVT